jgi:predicted phosphodiesterase
MAKFAVISDIHSNIEALSAVLEDISDQGVDHIICLGDVVGYGPNPLECVDLIMRNCRVVLRGNHDEALVHGAYAFNLAARRAIDWTREMLRPRFFSGAAVRRRWDFLCGLPLRHEVGPDLFIHGSPRDPTNEYILTHDLANWPSEKFEEIFSGYERRLFVGHTHMPCVITDRYMTQTSTEMDNTYDFPAMCDRKAIINVGSVGQPRDRDTRACYVVVNDDVVRWRRVPYDYEFTAAKIDAIQELDPVLSARLKVGS